MEVMGEDGEEYNHTYVDIPKAKAAGLSLEDEVTLVIKGKVKGLNLYDDTVDVSIRYPNGNIKFKKNETDDQKFIDDMVGELG